MKFVYSELLYGFILSVIYDVSILLIYNSINTEPPHILRTSLAMVMNTLIYHLGIKLAETVRLASFDVESLFTNVPVPETLKIQ